MLSSACRVWRRRGEPNTSAPAWTSRTALP